MDLAELNAVARALAAKILAAFPGWACALQPYGPSQDVEANTGDVRFAIAPPARPTHLLEVVLRGNCVEVRYHDSQPPGPAEQVFVDLDREPDAASDAVVSFLRDVIDGRVVIVREPLGRFIRLVRGRKYESLARFRSSTEVAKTPDRYTALYHWMA